MAHQLRPAAVLCVLLLVSAASAQDANVFGASKKSNFEALRDKVTQVSVFAWSAEHNLCRNPDPPPPGRLEGLQYHSTTNELRLEY